MELKNILLRLIGLVFSVQFTQIYTIAALKPKSLAAEAQVAVAKISMEEREKMFMAIADRNLDAIWQLNALGMTVDPRAYYRTKPLHKAVDSKDLRIVKTVLGLSKPLAHYETECLLDAYAYAQQRYDFIKSRPTGPLLDAKFRLFYQENFAYQEDLEICQFLEQRVKRLGITTAYTTITVYIPERDDSYPNYSLLYPWLHRATESNIADQCLIRALLEHDDSAELLCGPAQTSAELAVQTSAKLESWRAREIKQLTFTDITEIEDQASFGSVPELAKFDHANVKVGAAVLAAQAFRPQRVPHEAPMHPVIVPDPVNTVSTEQLFDELEQAEVSLAPRAANSYLCGSVAALTVAILAMTYSYYNYFN